GTTAISAKVNNQLVPLNYELKNGDQVEIISSPKQKPKAEWLQFVKTIRAKRVINEYFKEERKQNIKKGEELFKRQINILRSQGYNVSEDHEAINEMLAYFRIPGKEMFLEMLGSHRIDLAKLVDFINKKKESLNQVSENKPGNREVVDAKSFDKLLKSKGLLPDNLTIGDSELIDYRLSPCCEPVPGDDIFGFIEPGKGIYVHKTSCLQARELMSFHGTRIVRARWTEHSDIAFLAGFKIVGADRYGMLNDLVRVISVKMKKNIRSITIDTFNGMFEGLIRVYVNNNKEVEKLINQLKQINDVYTVTRATEEQQFL
ncbi:MAG: TGS domain-containing protein, partial [Bacteroidia bacterium]|nr:TGS domain-containing protein [Bacteroidia bacterium]